MSTLYVTEPPTDGKVILHTSKGEIEIELWSKEAPKACRNLVALALEGYYDGCLWHRIVPQFCIQTGDPTGTGSGGESIYGEPFADELHQRLRFNRRGLVAMANAGTRNSNDSQFFVRAVRSPRSRSMPRPSCRTNIPFLDASLVRPSTTCLRSPKSSSPPRSQTGPSTLPSCCASRSSTTPSQTLCRASRAKNARHRPARKSTLPNAAPSQSTSGRRRRRTRRCSVSVRRRRWTPCRAPQRSRSAATTSCTTKSSARNRCGEQRSRRRRRRRRRRRSRPFLCVLPHRRNARRTQNPLRHARHPHPPTLRRVRSRTRSAETRTLLLRRGRWRYSMGAVVTCSPRWWPNTDKKAESLTAGKLRRRPCQNWRHSGGRFANRKPHDPHSHRRHRARPTTRKRCTSTVQVTTMTMLIGATIGTS